MEGGEVSVSAGNLVWIEFALLVKLPRTTNLAFQFHGISYFKICLASKIVQCQSHSS